MERGFHVSVIRRIQPVAIVELYGYLDASTANELDNLLARLLEEGYTKIVLNCAGLEYISSAGLGVFMGHIESYRAVGGDLRFCSLRERIATIVEMLGFPLIFHFFPDCQTAEASYSNSKS